MTGRRDASAQPDHSHAGQESGGNPERWHETVERND